MIRAAGIASAGELLVEFVRGDKGSRHLQAGTYSGPYPSGAPGIFIDQAAKVGGRCIFVGAVGDDAFGKVIVERLTADAVDTSLIEVLPGVPTGSAFVSYNTDGSRDFVYNIAKSAAPLFQDLESAGPVLEKFGLDYLHVSGAALGDDVMRGKILGLCRELHRRGVKISFDPNVRKELINSGGYFDAVKDIMAMSTIFLPSEDDALALFRTENLSEFAKDLLAQGVACVVLKKGDQGCDAINNEGERTSLGAHRVTVLDPTGAGDCFCATFVTLLASRRYSFADVLKLANAAGALAVTKVGPMEGNSTLKEIERFLAAQA